MAADRYKYFRIEAREILEQLGQGALDLEKGAPAPDALARLLRLAHTLKGAARVVKQKEIADHAHALEDTLAPWRDAGTVPPRDRIDHVLGLVDAIARLVAQLTPAPDAADAPHPGTDAMPAAATLPAAAARLEMDDLDALLNGVVQANVRLEAMRPKLAQVLRARHAATLVVDQLGRGRGADAVRGGPHATEKARTMAADLPGLFGRLERDLASQVDQLDHELRQVRDAAERLRLAPLSGLFTFLERAVRDVATTLGKRIVFEAAGGDIRVDAVVLTVVQGALQHIVRNAAVHGIEIAPAERRAAGKPIDGRIGLTVTHRGRLVSFTCTDDGRGIDLEAVRRGTRRRGISEDAAQAMDTPALLRELLKGGITTSPTITGMAGRGIGLDVVREAAERLGGEVLARTEPGRGTTIELVVPVSVASFAALVVEAAAHTLAIPLDAVGSARRVAPEDIIRSGERDTILVDETAVPLAALAQFVAADRAATAPSARASAVVVRGASATAAFIVDRVVGTGRITMRRLPELAPASAIVAGVALDAVGDPLLVFDPERLVAAAHHARVAAAETPGPTRAVLVVDDSLTTRMLEQSILESAGYDVAVAASGEEGLITARAGRYALILVDVEMPGMDGFTFIERIRADADLRHIPAILVTSRGAAEDRQRGVDVGAQGYIVKTDFDQGVLLDRIRVLVG